MNGKRLTWLTMLLAASSCGGFDQTQVEDIPHDSTIPEISAPPTVTPYTGTQAVTLNAQSNMPTISDFHQQVIRRSCSGTAGVCHNQKEYPDMQSSQAFLQLVGAPCNASPTDPLSVYDRCEQLGDSITFPSRDSSTEEVGSIVIIDGERIDYEAQNLVPQNDSPGLHIFTHEAVDIETSDGNFYTTATFDRRVNIGGTVQELKISEFEGKWWILDDGKHLFVEVNNWQRNNLEQLSNASIRQGDINRNNTFGAKIAQPLSLLTPGRPQASYLLGRLVGELAGEMVPGTRMPLANLPPTLEELVALTCLIETLEENSNASPNWPIDYRNCSVRDNPNAIMPSGNGNGGFSQGVLPILQNNCGGCHSGDMPFAGLNLVDGGTRGRLLGPTLSNPLLNYVTPGSPADSYLWLKLINDPSIAGRGMPRDSEGNWRSLNTAQLDTIRTWIEDGALDD